MAKNMLSFAENRCQEFPDMIENAKLKYSHAKKELNDWMKRLREVK